MRDYAEQINSIRLCVESDDSVDECCLEDCNQHHAIDLPDDDDCISAEVVLRKLNRIGIVRKEEDSWVYDREKVTGNETAQAQAEKSRS